MFPQLYDNAGLKVAVLDNIIKDTATIKRVVNGEFTLTFEAYEKELKSEYFGFDNSIKVDAQTFDIKYIEQKHDIEVRYKIECEHCNYRLADGESNQYETYAYTGTPTQILDNILSGTDFNVGLVDFTNVITISVNKKINKKALIYALAKILGAEVEYTNEGFTINLLDSIGTDNGFQVRFGKNLKGVTKIIDSRGGLKTYYKVDLIELKNSNEYIEKKLQDLEVIGAGDTVRVIDEVIGLDIENRIFSIEYNPIFAINTKLEIANTIETITDTINQIDTTVVKQDELYNNVSISSEYGFRSVRSDNKAMVDMNATEGITISTRSAVENPYEKNFEIDTDGNIVMKGKITLEAGSVLPDLGLGTLAYEDDVDWNSNLLNIPGTLKAPSGTGLFLSSGHLGFMSGGVWKTYMDGNGNFYLGGISGKLQWNAADNILQINGAIAIASGSSGISNLSDAGALATANNLDGVPDGSAFKRTTTNEKTGAGRAYSSINSSNNFISRVTPTAAMGTPSGAGLYMGSDYIGLYNSGWKSFIKNDGTFKFEGNANNFIEWDGSNLNVKGGIMADGNITGSSFYGATLNSAYLKIGTRGGNFGDMAIYKGGTTTPTIRFYDAGEITDLIPYGTDGSLTGRILSMASGYAEARGTWDFSNATITGFQVKFG